jgi:hypothetical protein
MFPQATGEELESSRRQGIYRKMIETMHDEDEKQELRMHVRDTFAIGRI